MANFDFRTPVQLNILSETDISKNLLNKKYLFLSDNVVIDTSGDLFSHLSGDDFTKVATAKQVNQLYNVILQNVTNLKTDTDNKISSILSNTSPEKIDSFTEVVNNLSDFNNKIKSKSKRESVNVGLSNYIYADCFQPAPLNVLIHNNLIKKPDKTVDNESISLYKLFNGWIFNRIYSITYEPTISSKKINWYIPNMTNMKSNEIHYIYINTIFRSSQLLNNTDLLPFFAMYTKPSTDTARNMASWYRSRLMWIPENTNMLENGINKNTNGTYTFVLKVNPPNPQWENNDDYDVVSLKGFTQIKLNIGNNIGSASGGGTKISALDLDASGNFNFSLQQELMSFSIGTNSGSSNDLDVEFMISSVSVQNTDGVYTCSFDNSDVESKFISDKTNKLYDYLFKKNILDNFEPTRPN